MLDIVLVLVGSGAVRVKYISSYDRLYANGSLSICSPNRVNKIIKGANTYHKIISAAFRWDGTGGVVKTTI